MHAILHQHGKRSPASDTFGRKGREWLRKVSLPPVAREAVNTYCELIDQTGQHIRKQELRLKELASSDARAKWLATIPGVGTYSAMIILSEIGDIARFPTAKSLFSYAGLVPRVRESAGHQSRGGISRCGSPRLRWVLVEAAHTALRCSPAARSYFDRLRRRKHPHVARVALARKLLAAVFAMLRDGECFDETIFAAV